jgi:hypothetical protein
VSKRSTLIGAVILAGGAISAGLAMPGCSSSGDSGGTPTDGGTDSGGAYVSVVPPKRPASGSGTGTKFFAVNALKLGITKKGTTTPDPNAWKDYGFDLDGRNTTAEDSKTSNNSCKRKSGSPTSILADGNGGIDNNFGGHVMQTIKSLKSDAEDAVNTSITGGSFTLILKIENATDGADSTKSPGSLYVANDFNDKKSAPTFTTSDVWKVNAASLEDGTSLSKPKLTFPNAYIANGYWVSGDFGTGTINLNISLSGADISLPIDSGIITVKLSDGTDGTIAGAMNTDKLKDALTPVAKKFGICPGNATYDQVVDTLTQSADLVSGAPQLQNPAVECTAISIALGFTMKPTGEPKEVIPTPPPSGTDDCSGETGADGSSDAGG